MPYRRLPNTTPAVIRTLKTARDQWLNTPNPADRALSAEQWAQLDPAVPGSLLNRLLKEASDVDKAIAAQAPVTSQFSGVADRLAMTCSHFHQVFDLGVARGTFAAGARSYYQRTVTANSIPNLSSHDDLLEAAENIVQGEADRAAAEGHAVTYDSSVTYDSGVRFDSVTGYVAMALPSAAEVAALLAQFKTLRSESNEVLVETDKQREELQAVYPDALALAVDICDTVEFFYRKDPDASSRRQKCERWGVVYVADAAPVAPTPAPTPTPPTP